MIQLTYQWYMIVPITHSWRYEWSKTTMIHVDPVVFLNTNYTFMIIIIFIPMVIQWSNRFLYQSWLEFLNQLITNFTNAQGAGLLALLAAQQAQQAQGEVPEEYLEPPPAQVEATWKAWEHGEESMGDVEMVVWMRWSNKNDWANSYQTYPIQMVVYQSLNH